MIDPPQISDRDRVLLDNGFDPIGNVEQLIDDLLTSYGQGPAQGFMSTETCTCARCRAIRFVTNKE